MDELNYVQIKPRQHIAYCICTKRREKEFSECCLSFDGTIVINASFVKNLSIFFDRTLCMQKQASAITKSCYFQIRNIERNRSYTTEDACKTLVCSLIVRDSSVVRRHYIFFLEPSDVRALCIRKTADLLLQLWVSTFPRFVAIGFYFLSETLI